jgi:dCMP deaminase
MNAMSAKGLRGGRTDAACMRLAHEVAAQSKDPSTHVGAVLLSPDGKTRYSGYNRFPAGVPDKKKWWTNRDGSSREFSKYDLACCAEVDAITSARSSLHGWTLYITHFPCLSCAKLIALVGIRRVVYEMGQSQVRMDLKAEKVRRLFRIAKVSLVRSSRRE